MAKAKKQEWDVVEGIPQWAVCGFVNDDWSGCTEEDVKLAKNYQRKLAKDGWVLICDIDGSENEFNRFPAFGLAGATVDFSIMREVNNE